jgi:threonine dehydratase
MSQPHPPAPPVFADIEAAARRLRGQSVVTPLLSSAALDKLTGLRLLVKAESLQRTGSFKFRGAYNAISNLPGELRGAGVVACSSGNHAQGVAEAARIFGVPATIVMPTNAPALKIDRTRRAGADIIPYDRATGDRDDIADEFSKRTGAQLIHPYDNPDVIAGQGTCGLEICQQLEAAGIVPDRVLVCTGGGGLTAGIAVAIHGRFPQAKIYSCEPEGFDDHRRSLESGTRVANDRKTGSACDALLSPTPGEVTFQVNREHLSGGFAVSDAQAFEAMRIAFAELKLVLEPGGAVALAAALANAKQWRGETVVAVLSGGNVDPALFSDVLAGRA